MAGTRGKRKLPRHPPEEYVEYLLVVDDWDYSCSLSPADGRHLLGRGFYDEFQPLKFKGHWVEPKGFKYPECVVTLSGKEGLLQEEHERPLKGIGGMWVTWDSLDVYVDVSAARMAELVTFAVADRIKRIGWTGTKLKYRKGTVRYLRTNSELEDEGDGDENSPA
jgi:hypothetical protein